MCFTDSNDSEGQALRRIDRGEDADAGEPLGYLLFDGEDLFFAEEGVGGFHRGVPNIYERIDEFATALVVLANRGHESGLHFFQRLCESRIVARLARYKD